MSGVLRVVAKRESSFVGLRVRESGARVMRFGLERRARVQGMRRKGAVVSEGAITLEVGRGLVLGSPRKLNQLFVMFREKCGEKIY